MTWKFSQEVEASFHFPGNQLSARGLVPPWRGDFGLNLGKCVPVKAPPEQPG